ncbi:hypothetical protein M422DRAFT_72159, partial [Sphaerobolus stellatus SS14]
MSNANYDTELSLFGSHAAASISLFVIDLTSTIGLCAVLLTTSLSQRITRHALFTNLAITLLLYSSFKCYTSIIIFSWQKFVKVTGKEESGSDIIGIDAWDGPFFLFQTMLEDILWISTQIAMLNLIIYLWFTFKSVIGTPAAPSKEGKRTAALLITPYIF